MSMKNVADFYPLSPMQQGMLFHTLYAPEDGLYFQQLICTLRSKLDVEAFQRAWQEVIKRHPALRTSFLWDGVKEPLQLVHREARLPWQQHDFRSLSVAEQEARIAALSHQDRALGFDLSRAPLLRCVLFQLTDDSFRFIWSFHHALLDGWSMHLILREVLADYEGSLRGRQAQLPPVRPFRNYIAWLRRQNDSQHETFWRRTLAGFASPTQLGVEPTPGSLLRREQEQQQVREMSLPAKLTMALQSLVKQQRVTLSTLLQGAWGLLLSRYSGEPDVLFGVTVSGRDAGLAGIETMVGLLINTLPLRIEAHPQMALTAYLKDVQARQFEMSEHAHIPLSKIQEWSDVPRTSALFESIVVFENHRADVAPLQPGQGLTVSDFNVLEKTNYPLTLEVIPGEELRLRLIYDAHRVETVAVERILGHLATMLENMAARPSQSLSDVELMTIAERQQVLVKWNETRALYPRQQTLHELIEAQVERTPEALALACDGTPLSYRELNRRANQLAHHLCKLGVGPDVLVGIYMERSLEMVVGLLGILKAGGAYVPLDPGYPRERIAYMLRDTRVPVLLTQARLEQTLPANAARVLCVDSEWTTVAQERQENPAPLAGEDNLAYVIYTSGSTGQPKGSMISHSGICNRLHWMQEAYQLTGADRVLQKTPFSFDVSVWEFFWPLMSGASLVIARPGGHQDSSYLVRLIGEQKITTIHFVPSMLQMFVQEPGLEHCRSLRRVICSGEALPFDLQERFFGCLDAELHNLYGPTEASVDVTSWACRRDGQENLVPIGQPIANIQIYLLSPDLKALPVGVPGELHIGGIGLARGYLNRPELTAEKFIPNPFALSPGERLYKSGDRARFLPTGDIEYLGRLDHQVKIRGYRIELGEVQAALLRQTTITAAVVLAREDMPGEKRLVAYLVASRETELSITELRSNLKRELPDYMIPSAFVVLEAMPLSANGKIERRWLPRPGQQRPELDEAYISPRTPQEQVLTEVWAQVLDVERVGVHDNYFALGGDSIRSILVCSRAQERGVNFSLAELFQHQTVEELARVVGEREALTRQELILEPFALVNEEDRQLIGAEIEDAYPLTMLQAGMLFHSELKQNSAIYHDIFSYYLRGPLNQEALRVAVQQLASRHAALRTSFDLTRFTERLQLIHKQVEVPVAVQDLCGLSPAEQEEALESWIEAEKNRPFEWTQAPLLRFQIHQRSVEAFQLTLSFHHVILDGWSVASMLTELFQIYQALRSKATAPLATAPQTLFRDFVALERETLASTESQRFWSERLNDCIIAPLPRWSNSGAAAAKGKRLQVHHVSIPANLSGGLRQVAQAVGVPLKSVLLAAHLRVMSLLSGQQDVLTGLVANGRLERTGGERVLGLFLNSLPLRLNLRGGTWQQLVRRTFAAEQEMAPHRRYPLAQIQGMLGRQALFETAFNFAHFHVYQGMAGFEEMQLVSGRYFEETNFVLVANFEQDPASAALELHLSYDATQLCAEQVSTIGDYYLATLQAIAADPLAPYHYHSPLSAEQQQQLRDLWNGAQTLYPKDSCIHELFEAQVEQRPEAVAVICGDESWSYAELNRRANRLAHYLRGKGVCAEVPVALYLDRSAEMVVSLLAVLKAGGAYVPLDTTQPRERLDHIMRDTGAVIILSQQALVEDFSAEGVEVICLDVDRYLIARESDENPTRNTTALGLAYVMYTSGSTGGPKGVCITHRNVVRLVKENAYVRFGTDEVFLQLAPASFDAATFELWGSLLNGASLVVMPSQHTALDLGKALERYGVTTLWLTAGLFHLMVDECLEDLHPLRQLLAGGDVLSVPHVQRVLTQLPECRLINGYGPTESTTFACCYTVDKLEQGDCSISIGRPIANTKAILLDRFLQPVPIGVTGELYLGGDGLGRGYLNRPELTAENFIPDSFSEIPGVRLYRTGDLARLRPDGNLEFLGRADHQVKVRGFRIEPGEVEATLSQHHAVREAVIVAQQDGPADKRLIGYIVPRQGTSLSITELRRFLMEKLPEYMVPSAFVMLETLPLTQNGKIDRRALPLPDATRPAIEKDFVAPRNALEEMLSKMWERTLKVEGVGACDDFFELGGDSLRATQLMAQVRDAFQVQLPLQSLFEQRTVAGLAEALIQHESVPGQAHATARIQQKIERMSAAEIWANLHKMTESVEGTNYGD